MTESVRQPNTSVLSLRGLSKTFTGTKALDQVEFDVVEGEVHALVGQNGSGKSTLIKILAGFHQADEGVRASVRGEAVELGDPIVVHAAGLRFVHQDLGLVMTESTIDNLALGSGYQTNRVGMINWTEQRRRASRLLEDLGHEIDVRIPVERLSAVERTAVAIARAMQDSISSIALLVMDEPTATMPAHDVEMIYDLVRRVRDSGASVLYVSHHLDEVFELSDRVTVLRDGHKIETVYTADTTPRDIANQMAGGHVDIRERSERRMGRPVLELHRVSVKVLQRLDLTVHAGEIVGLAGIDGSGRDEVAMAVFGGRARQGRVVSDGVELGPSRPDQAVERGIGLVPADRAGAGLLPDLSVRENMTLPRLGEFWQRYILRIGRERSDVAEWVHRLGVVAPKAEVPVTALSGGNQQKVVIGKWLRIKPKVLLLDEPTQGVDVAAKAEVHRLIDDAAEQGAAVLVCSSDETELVRLCSRVLVLDHGRVCAELSGNQINRAAISRASLGVVNEPHQDGVSS